MDYQHLVVLHLECLLLQGFLRWVESRVDSNTLHCTLWSYRYRAV